MKRLILICLLFFIASCKTTRIGYVDDVYYSNPRYFFDDLNYRHNWFMERQMFPQFYYGYPYVPFDLLIQQPDINRAPRKVLTPPKQNTTKPNPSTAPVRKFNNKN
jgi:hypothetical protein